MCHLMEFPDSFLVVVRTQKKILSSRVFLRLIAIQLRNKLQDENIGFEHIRISSNQNSKLMTKMWASEVCEKEIFLASTTEILD